MRASGLSNIFRCFTRVCALGSIAIGHVSISQAQETTTAEVGMSHAPQTTAIDHPLEPAQNYGFITNLPAGYTPLAISNNGIALLSYGTLYYRWSNGLLAPLTPSRDADKAKLGQYRWAINRLTGSIAVQYQYSFFTRVSVGSRSLDRSTIDSFVDFWPSSATAPSRLENQPAPFTFTKIDTAPSFLLAPPYESSVFISGNTIRDIAPIAVDATDNIWCTELIKVTSGTYTPYGYQEGGIESADELDYANTIRTAPSTTPGTILGGGQNFPYKSYSNVADIYIDNGGYLTAGNGYSTGNFNINDVQIVSQQTSLGTQTTPATFQYSVGIAGHLSNPSYQPLGLNDQNTVLGAQPPVTSGSAHTLYFYSNNDFSTPTKTLLLPADASGMDNLSRPAGSINGKGFVVNTTVVNGQTQSTKLFNLQLRPPAGFTTTQQVGADVQQNQIGLMQNTSGVAQPFIAFPMGLAVDANRDGNIIFGSEDSSDATSASTPFRFWLNDDVDRYHQDPGYSESEFDDIDPTEIASQGWQPDWTYNQITSLRDLEDFSRLWISLHGITDAVRNGDLYIGLRWSNTTGDPWIKLYPHVEADGGTKYLFDSSTAGVPLTQQSATNAIADLRTGSSVTIVAPEDGTFVFPTSVFANLTESAPVTHLLFEGCQAGTGQLKIVILKKDGASYTEIGQGPGVWLDLKEPKEFIQRWSSGDGDRAAPQSWVLLNANSGTFAPPATDDEKDMVLYVHGYNMNGGADLAGDKQRWIETTYKRLYWLGYKGRVGGFSWPCAIQGGFTDNKGFDDSEQRAWQSGMYLMQLLSSLKTAGYRVHLLAHSQGNIVAGEALSLWKALGNTTPLVSTYIASQGAIPAHCYDATLPSRTDFTPSTPNVYEHYWKSGDSATLPSTWGTSNSSYLATSYVQNAAGRFANFYNPDDYALTGNGFTGSEHPGWMIDQRLKPDTTYGYSSTNGFNIGHVPLRFPDDHYQIFSYAAQAWSLALGATSTGGVFNQNAVNLKASFTFGSEHLWHSGEFRSYNAARYRYWMSLLDAALITHLNP